MRTLAAIILFAICLSLDQIMVHAVSLKLPQKWMKSLAIGTIAAGTAFGPIHGTGLSSLNSIALADAIPVVGSDAPDFKLPSNAGKDISLSDLKGKRTVLYFYPGDFTQGCTIEAQSFERDIQKYKDLNVNLVGVSVDSIDKHLDFGKKYGLDFPLLSDQGGVISNKYGSLLDIGFLGKFSNRQTYIISPDGKVEYVFTDVESHLSEHSASVLKVLQSLA